MAGGQPAIRGYLVQTLIALLDMLDEDRPWTSVTLEPNIDSEKVDVLWEYADGRKKAFQVKSSQNPFGQGQVKGWAADLESWKAADEYELMLVGTPASRAVAQIGTVGKVAVPPPKNSDLRAFKEQAAHRLDRFLQGRGLPPGDADYRELVAGALADKIATLSTKGEQLTKTDLIERLARWVPEPADSADRASASRIVPVASRQIVEAVTMLRRQLFVEPTARGVKRLLYEAERLPKDDPDVRLLVDELKQALTAPAIGFGLILARLALPDRLQAADALGKFGDPRIDFNSPDYWVTIPADSFLMGAQSKNPNEPNYDEDAFDRMEPVHRIHLSQYGIARYPVTVGQYRQFVEDGGDRDRRCWNSGGFGMFSKPNEWEPQLQYPSRPVCGVNWYEAAAFCAWADYRLATEAEWERAARGTEGRKYPWGNEPTDPSRLNYIESKIDHPTPVGVYPLGNTPDGICDMAGNVWEWCQDWYEYPAQAVSNPQGSSQAARRVIRVGCWRDGARFCRAASRGGIGPRLRGDDLGFRVARGPSG